MEPNPDAQPRPERKRPFAFPDIIRHHGIEDLSETVDERKKALLEHRSPLIALVDAERLLLHHARVEEHYGEELYFGPLSEEEMDALERNALSYLWYGCAEMERRPHDARNALAMVDAWLQTFSEPRIGICESVRSRMDPLVEYVNERCQQGSLVEKARLDDAERENTRLRALLDGMRQGAENQQAAPVPEQTAQQPPPLPRLDLRRLEAARQAEDEAEYLRAEEEAQAEFEAEEDRRIAEANQRQRIRESLDAALKLRAEQGDSPRRYRNPSAYIQAVAARMPKWGNKPASYNSLRTLWSNFSLYSSKQFPSTADGAFHLRCSIEGFALKAEYERRPVDANEQPVQLLIGGRRVGIDPPLGSNVDRNAATPTAMLQPE
jgi:hypothetical protein